MHRLNGSHQPSVDEILASIRASIAEEAAVEITKTEPRYRFTPLHTPPANDEEPGEFELPSMFKPTSPGAPEKHTRLFGRLTEAIKNAVPEQGFSAKITSVEPAANAARPAQPVNAPVERPVAQEVKQEEVKRVMVPFKDCKMSRMGQLNASNPKPAVDTPIAPVPADALSSGSWAGTFPQTRPAAPSPYAAPVSDFGTIVPSRMEPAYGHQAETVIQSPLSHNPMPQYQQPVPQEPLKNGYGHHPSNAANPVDDAAAQLLRPMLRQWLTDNMPKIVEQALLSEITQGGPAKKNGHNH